MKPVLIALTCLFILAPFAWGEEYVTWTDEAGVVHYGDSDADIPPRYREQVKEREFSATHPTSTVLQNSGGEEPIIDATKPSKNAWKPKVFKIKFRRWEETARRIILDVRLNNKVTVPMVLDTGAPGTMISHKVAAKLGLTPDKAGALITWAGGIGGATPAIKTVLDTVAVGEMKDTFVPTTVADFRRDGLYEGLLGMSFMSNYSMTIDHAHGALTFEELPPDRKRPGGHDREWWLSTFWQFAQQRARWRSYLKQLKDRERSSEFTGQTMANIQRLLTFVTYQEEQASEMFDRLDRYAAYNGVPTEWRRY